MAMCSCSAMATSKLDFPFPWPRGSVHKFSLSSLSIKSGTLLLYKGFLLPRRIAGLALPQHTTLSVFGSTVDNFSAEDTESCENAQRNEIKTSTWKWRSFSVRYQYSGTSGPAMVLIHGFGANSDHWRKNLPVLAESHRVYAIDLIGYGYSDKPDPDKLQLNYFYTFETWACQLNDFCKEIVKDEVFLVCNSIGGVVGLQAAVMDPLICKGIILLNISLRMLHIKKQPWYAKPLIKSFQSLLRNTTLGQLFFRSIATPESVRNILCQCYYDTSQVTDELVQIILEPGLDPGAADVFLDFICYSEGPLPEELLPQVECPVLVAWGDKDPWEPIDQGRAFAEFSCVEDFVVLPYVGHCPQVSPSLPSLCMCVYDPH